MIKKLMVHDYPQTFAEEYARQCSVKINEIIDKIEGTEKKKDD